MAIRVRQRVPRALLIYCEGKTEEEYFNALLDFYRLPWFVEVEVYGQRGQHYALVDNAVERRDKLQAELQVFEDEIECWAVCDEDRMSCSYAELKRYGEERGVHLGFSAPQFEMYLLQHFEQSGDVDRGMVFRKLSAYRREFGADGDYGDDSKADLSWLSAAIDRKPKIVKTAIINSDIRSNAMKRPFLTVQELTKRILELSI